MVEKQYKNYDERFLKEESSGSRSVIEYYLEDENEVIDSEKVYLKGKFPDGSYCQSPQDVISLFISSPIISLKQKTAESIAIYCSPINVMTSGEETAMYLHTGEANSDNATICMVDTPMFEQIKQTKS